MPASTATGLLTTLLTDLHVAAQVQMLQVQQLASAQHLHSLRGQVVVRDVKEL